MNRYLKKYGVDAMGAMAQGLFCTLLVGTILNTLGQQLDVAFLVRIGGFASAMAGPAMAVAIGYALKAQPLVLFSLVPVGFATNQLGGAGGPFAVYIVAIVAAELGKIVSGKTRIDILVTPLFTLLVGIGLALLIASPVGKAASWVGNVIMWATMLHPFLMGIVVALVVGMALTLPISSAAICAGLSLTGLAGGAALAGCCAQMVGFAVLSFRDNRWSGVLSQGIGTSMLQMGNIIRKPLVWVPVMLTSAIMGPLATCVFKLQMNGAAVNSGMGTCGLCGPIGVWTGWLAPSDAALASGAVAITPSAFDYLCLLLVSIVLPALICGLLGAVFRKAGWIRAGDLKI